MPKMPKRKSARPEDFLKHPLKVGDTITDDTVVVCAFNGYFADDVKTVCVECGAAIVHRPHAPAKAKKLCLDCAADLLEKDPGPHDFQVTTKSVQEVAMLFTKPKGRA